MSEKKEPEGQLPIPQEPVPTSTADKIRNAVALGFCGIGGVAVAVWLILQSTEVLQSANWPKTEGVMESSTARQKQLSGNRWSWVAEVKYSYTVDGNKYTGSRYNTHNDVLADEAEANTIATQTHRKGTKVQVTYDPKNPGQSFLDGKITINSWAQLGIGIVAGIGGFAALVFLVLGFLPAKKNVASSTSGA
jgi:hypothetical protein